MALNKLITTNQQKMSYSLLDTTTNNNNNKTTTPISFEQTPNKLVYKKVFFFLRF
jgi:hypothetical protein